MGLVDLVQYVWGHPLNAHGKVAALGRIARWQVASRLMNGPVALPFVDDTHLFATRGMTGATGNWYCGLHEVAEMAFVLHFLREGEHFVDIGANIGSYTVLAGGGVGARVTAVEPIPSTYAHLARNVALNGLGDRVRPHRVGLSDRNGSLRFTAGLDTINHVLAPNEDAPSIEVPVRTLDDMIGGDVPSLMKIDVEGHEHPVLLGAQRTLADRRLSAVIMETNGSGARYDIADEALLEIMRSHGFAERSYDPFARELRAVGTSSGNTIFVRDEAAVRARVASARHHRLVNGTI